MLGRQRVDVVERDVENVGRARGRGRRAVEFICLPTIVDTKGELNVAAADLEERAGHRGVELPGLIAAAIKHCSLGRNRRQSVDRLLRLGEAERIENAGVEQADNARAGGARRCGRARIIGADVVDRRRGIVGELNAPEIIAAAKHGLRFAARVGSAGPIGPVREQGPLSAERDAEGFRIGFIFARAADRAAPAAGDRPAVPCVERRDLCGPVRICRNVERRADRVEHLVIGRGGVGVERIGPRQSSGAGRILVGRELFGRIRVRAGEFGRFHALPIYMATSRARNTASWCRWNASGVETASGLRDLGGGVGVRDPAAARREVHAGSAGSGLPLG